MITARQIKKICFNDFKHQPQNYTFTPVIVIKRPEYRKPYNSAIQVVEFFGRLNDPFKNTTSVQFTFFKYKNTISVHDAQRSH